MAGEKNNSNTLAIVLVAILVIVALLIFSGKIISYFKQKSVDKLLNSGNNQGSAFNPSTMQSAGQGCLMSNDDLNKNLNILLQAYSLENNSFIYRWFYGFFGLSNWNDCGAFTTVMSNCQNKQQVSALAAAYQQSTGRTLLQDVYNACCSAWLSPQSNEDVFESDINTAESYNECTGSPVGVLNNAQTSIQNATEF